MRRRAPSAGVGVAKEKSAHCLICWPKPRVVFFFAFVFQSVEKGESRTLPRYLNIVNFNPMGGKLPNFGAREGGRKKKII